MKDRIKEFRITLKVSKAEMARLLGIVPQAYSHYESGKNEPSAKVLKALAGMGCNIHWLITGEPPQKEMSASGRETRLEIENEMLRDQIKELREDLKDVAKGRDNHLHTPTGRTAPLASIHSSGVKR